MSDSCGDSFASWRNDTDDSTLHFGFGKSRRLASSTRPSPNLPGATPKLDASHTRSAGNRPPYQGNVQTESKAPTPSKVSISVRSLPPTCDPPASAQAQSRPSPRLESSSNPQAHTQGHSAGTPRPLIKQADRNHSAGDEPAGCASMAADRVFDRDAGTQSNASKSTAMPAHGETRLCQVDVSVSGPAVPAPIGPCGGISISNGANIRGNVNFSVNGCTVYSSNVLSRSEKKSTVLTNRDSRIAFEKTNGAIDAQIALKPFEAVSHGLPRARVKLILQNGDLDVAVNYPDGVSGFTNPCRAHFNLLTEIAYGNMRISLDPRFLESIKIFLVLDRVATSQNIDPRLHGRLVFLLSKEDARIASHAHPGDSVVVVMSAGCVELNLKG